MLENEISNLNTLSIMLSKAVDEDEWNKICQIIEKALKEAGYITWEVCFY